MAKQSSTSKETRPSSSHMRRRSLRPIYHPLKPDFNEIRLLRLYPGRFADDIEGSMSVVSLDDRPKYETLSYVWGGATLTRPIHINGRELQVTQNLAEALRYLREDSDHRAIPTTERFGSIPSVSTGPTSLREASKSIRCVGSTVNQRKL